jgi:hypothetical protein
MGFGEEERKDVVESALFLLLRMKVVAAVVVAVARTEE